MKIIVGLGNPGQQYAATRHNLGFMVVDEIARRHTVSDRHKRFRSEINTVTIGGERVVLVKPQTYMNLSGAAVREVVAWYKADAESLLVVLDEIDLPFGTTRMRPGGGSGGHNGMKSIIDDLGTDSFARLRLGIGRGHGSVTGQVLNRFNKEESTALPDLVARGAQCAINWVEEGVIAAMNRCNQPQADSSAGERALGTPSATRSSAAPSLTAPAPRRSLRARIDDVMRSAKNQPGKGTTTDHE